MLLYPTCRLQLPSNSICLATYTFLLPNIDEFQVFVRNESSVGGRKQKTQSLFERLASSTLRGQMVMGMVSALLTAGVGFILGPGTVAIRLQPPPLGSQTAKTAKLPAPNC